LPPPTEQSVLARHESLYRFLRKATHHDPERRFHSADEMADQLGGVLREVIAGETTPKPVESLLFHGDALALHEQDALDAPDARVLHDLKANADDSGSSFLLSIGGVADPRRRADLLRGALTKFSESAELPLRLARTLIHLRAFAEAEEQLAAVAARDPFDWRVTWYRGLSLLAQNKPREARAAFDQVYSELPGEPAAKLAVAAAAEAAGDAATAIRLYDLVSRTDPGFVTASFGLARCLARAGKRAEAVDAYNRVPANSSLHVRAQMGLTRVLIGLKPDPPSVDDLRKASAAVEALALEGREWARLRREVLENALSLLGKALKPDPAVRLLGRPLEDAALRFGLEETLRQLAHLEPDPQRQIELVDQANRVRPITWI
jgi:serine/threonine-protein kinase PknG